MSPSVVIADDHPLMLDAIANLLSSAGFAIAARCVDGRQACEAINAQAPDLAVLDLNMPGFTGLELLTIARRDGWSTRIVLLTAGIEPDPLVKAVSLGVDGLVLKDAAGDILLRCLREVLAGETWIDREVMKQVLRLTVQPQPPEPKDELTPRERDVARLVALGRRNKEIAYQLGISEGTVKMYLHNLYEKLGIGSRTELAVLMRD